MLDHNFTGPPFTVGIEEELMILDPDGWDLAQAIEPLVAQIPERYERSPSDTRDRSSRS
jgi:glutamate---cysteine ligase / carboxylate-amine ligase